MVSVSSIHHVNTTVLQLQRGLGVQRRRVDVHGKGWLGWRGRGVFAAATSPAACIAIGVGRGPPRGHDGVVAQREEEERVEDVEDRGQHEEEVQAHPAEARDGVHDLQRGDDAHDDGEDERIDKPGQTAHAGVLGDDDHPPEVEEREEEAEDARHREAVEPVDVEDEVPF